MKSLSKGAVILIIAAISVLTIFMHWEAIKAKLIPDYGTDPYTLEQACKPKP